MTTKRDGITRIDWATRTLSIRKPRAMKPGDESSYACVQAKCDGIHVVCSRALTKFTQVISTAGHDLLNILVSDDVPWLIRVSSLPPEYFVEGELYVPGQGREAVKSYIADKRWSELRLAVFGTDCIAPESTLPSLEAWCEEHGFESLPYVSSDLTLGAMHDVPSDGLVYKDSMYGRWAKVKNERTIDCVVTGVVPGVGKYWGQVGALKLSVRRASDGLMIEIANASGMRDHVRASMDLADRDTWMRRVCEIEYERVGAKGRLQHPRFKCWREDKSLLECLTDQDPALDEYWRNK